MTVGGEGGEVVHAASLSGSCATHAATSVETAFARGSSRHSDRYFISSVEIVEPTERCPEGCDGYDRTTGSGAGHLFVVEESGELIADVQLGEGDMYHPGGIDFDGRWLWVPVAEYRPDSSSIVYRVDPTTLEVDEVFRVDDHIGGVVRDRVEGDVHGVSWGSRRMYEWTEDGSQLSRLSNPSHFIDYQDCEYLEHRKMLCGGVADLPGPDETTYKLGGLALFDLDDGQLLHEAPVPLFPSHTGNSITGNPVFVEATASGLRLYGAPDNDLDGAIHVYETVG